MFPKLSFVKEFILEKENQMRGDITNENNLNFSLIQLDQIEKILNCFMEDSFSDSNSSNFTNKINLYAPSDQEKIQEWDSEKGIWKNCTTIHSSIEYSQCNSLYIFAYGSLCWNIAPELKKCRTFKVYIQGFQRRFWQISTDHRGTVESPGLVCTLISDEDYLKLTGFTNEKASICYGLAFEIEKGSEREVLEALDYREKGGYVRKSIKIYMCENNKEINGIVYKGEINNPNFLNQSVRNNIIECARVIEKSEGPSGENFDYLMKLEEFLRLNSFHDEYIFKLSEITKMIREKSEKSKIYSIISLDKFFFDISISFIPKELEFCFWIFEIFYSSKKIPLDKIFSWLKFSDIPKEMYTLETNNMKNQLGLKFILDKEIYKKNGLNLFSMIESFCFTFISN